MLLNTRGKAIFILLFIITSITAFASDFPNDELLKSCDSKTIVYNKQGDRVGEKIDGFCAGYLQATFHGLRHNQKISCGSGLKEDKTAEYLFSIYNVYIKDKKVSVSESAYKTLLESYRRAFDCKDN